MKLETHRRKTLIDQETVMHLVITWALFYRQGYLFKKGLTIKGKKLFC